MELTTKQQDRAAGVLLGVGVGDALGIPYEFQPPQDFTEDQLPLGMPGGGPFKFGPGEFSDDTQMTLCVAAAAFEGLDLNSSAGLERVATGFLAWYRSGPRDVGGQVSSVLAQTPLCHDGTTWHSMAGRAATRYLNNLKGSGGNGSLMRTAPVALRHLYDRGRMTEAARYVSGLTHADPDCLDACVIWCHVIRAAVLFEAPRAGLVEGIRALEPSHRAKWSMLARQAEQWQPFVFSQNGWVVEAFQAAWSAVTIGLETGGFEPGITAAVACGKDTDTVAAIAGAVLGATFGSSDIRPKWRESLQGWQRVNGDDLARIGLEIALKA